MAKHYYYGMRLRPYGLGCQPMNGLIVAHKSVKFWNVLEYDRELSQAECIAYELEDLGSDYKCPLESL